MPRRKRLGHDRAPHCGFLIPESHLGGERRFGSCEVIRRMALVPALFAPSSLSYKALREREKRRNNHNKGDCTSAPLEVTSLIARRRKSSSAGRSRVRATPISERGGEHVHCPLCMRDVVNYTFRVDPLGRLSVCSALETAADNQMAAPFSLIRFSAAFHPRPSLSSSGLFVRTREMCMIFSLDHHGSKSAETSERNRRVRLFAYRSVVECAATGKKCGLN